MSNDRFQRLVLAFLLAGLVALGASPARGQENHAGGGQEGAGDGPAKRPSEAEIGRVQVYLTPDQAIHEIFANTVVVDTTRAVLDAGELEFLHKKLGRTMPGDSVLVLKPRDADGVLLGYAVISEETGKYRPITFMVGTDADLKVQNVEVLVYRESRGGEVRRERFLRQYRGKTPDDPIRTNRDILNIAGATLSVTALNYGIQRVLVTLSLLAERNAL